MKLREFRVQNQLTKKEMADSIDFSLSMYEKVEDGRMKPTGNFMRAFKSHYPNTSIDEIFFADGSIENAIEDRDSA